ncbi:hypothetical protein BPAE_0086g00160 [Botrytis paeoniae]|uniref:Serine hydrolase domain-containing protein n=1 Tax=Botrytis paeoniae TaxID=278948 RepID=A0A4Z1FU14_9HELO|nr:hypothetical protein BPAE_0086g00160 [Botrytis paeoniae]
MRFLCLHGIGTGKAILEAQLFMIRRQLPGHEFVFFQGEMETSPAPGVEMFFPGPYYSYFTVPSPNAVLAAIDRLEDFIDTQGPFDGILGFSQGAALAASYILHNSTRQHPRDDFRCAVFFCAIQCWDLDSPGFTLSYDGKCRSLGGPSKPPKVVCSTDDITSVFGAAYHPLLKGNWDSETELLWPFGRSPLRWSPLGCINIPTLHVIGSKDMYRGDSTILTKFCTAANAHIVETNGGHEISRDPAMVRKVSNFLQTAPSLM